MISLNYRDPGPVYDQIKRKLRDRILAGALEEGEKLPTVRDLAATLAINPNTIMRAYRELEAEGYIYTIQGRGSFVAPLSEVDSGRKEALVKSLGDAARELLRLGMGIDKLHSILDEQVKEEEG